MSNDFEIMLEGQLGGRGGEVSDSHRRMSAENKARILAESFETGVQVVEVARRNGLPAQRLYSWRSQARAVLKDGGDENGSATATGAPHTF